MVPWDARAVCGRYAASRDPDDLVEEFELAWMDVRERLAPDWNVAPTKEVYAVLTRPPRDHEQPPQPVAGTDAAAPPRRLRVLRWGLVPSWATDRAIGSRLINARIETVHEKPAFRRAFLQRRCILPADGYYEWFTPDGGRKQPWFIHPADGGVLAMAGLYELWRDPSRPRDDEDAWLWTSAVLTTTAEDGLGHLHDRMPLMLERERYDEWLDPSVTDPVALLALLTPAAPGRLQAHPVSRRVGDVRSNGPDLVVPVPAEDPTGARLF